MSSELKERFRQQLAKMLQAALDKDFIAVSLANEIVDQLTQLTQERDALREALKEAERLTAYKHETANTFMEQARRLGNERYEALKLLGYDETEIDLCANITRLKAHYESEMASIKQGQQQLIDYAAELQGQVDPKNAIAIGLKALLKSNFPASTGDSNEAS